METTNTSSKLDHGQCYRALSARDTRFDGVFFTGVKTTGIYCRPVCGVKTPRASSCDFYPSAAAAEAAGFRPCLRCRPELAPYALQENLAYAVWQRIAAGALNEGKLDALAAEVGLSTRQLRRVLVQHFGVTPIELAQTQRLLFAKKLLQETQLPMAELAFAAGFGSVRRFNTLFAARYGMAPSEIRRATTVTTVGQASLHLRLAYRPPFGWPETLAYLAVRAIAGVEAIGQTGGQAWYARSIRIGAVQGWVRVTHLPERQQLALELAPALAPVLMPVIARLRTQFDLDANPQIIHAHLAQDPLLAPVIARLPGTRVPGCFDAFELAVRAVLGQQVSVAGATTLSGRLVRQFGEPCETPFPGVTHHFPDPERLAHTDHLQIASIGLPKTRALTIRNLAQFAVDGGLTVRPGSSLAGVITQLRRVGGIGEWTAQYIALRALRFPDAFPAGDLGLQKAAAVEPMGTAEAIENGTAKLTTKLTEKQLLLRAANWAPWRGYAALLLWHSLG